MKINWIQREVEKAVDKVLNPPPPTLADEIIAWIDRMNSKHGPTVLDVEACQLWDWGQALAREVCGLNAMFHALPETIPEETRQVMEDWDAGNFPEWLREPHRVEKSQ